MNSPSCPREGQEGVIAYFDYYLTCQYYATTKFAKKFKAHHEKMR